MDHRFQDGRKRAGEKAKTRRNPKHAPNIRWAVVGTPAMVQRAKELATDRLMFLVHIEQAAAWLGDVDRVHSNGTIQCRDIVSVA